MSITLTEPAHRQSLTLSAGQREALRVAIDTLIPCVEDRSAEAFWRRKATDLAIDRRIEEAVAALPAGARREFAMLLTLLASPLPGLMLGGRPRSMARMRPTEREALLARWARSRLRTLRKAFASLKKMASFHYYAACVDEDNPNWRDIGYPGPPRHAKAPTRARRLATPADEGLIECDVLIIGSGAGGGVVAGVLGGRGLDVIVVDKGPDLPAQQRSWLEHDMISRLYEAGGMQTSNDHAISLFAGSCLGGGTTVNWSVSLRPGGELLREWAEQHDLPHLLSVDFQRGVEHVWRMADIRDSVPHNAQNRALLSGSRQLGYKAGPLPQNIRDCEHHNHEHCGFCLFGCPYGYKRDVVETYLRRAGDRGVRLYSGTRVRRLHRSGGEIAYAEAVAEVRGEPARSVTFRAQRYVLACGALHTPALLLASGFSHPQIGRNLYIHPVYLMLGRYPDRMEAWRGGMMTAACDAVTNLDGRHYGCKIETAPLHSGLLAALLPWHSGRQHKRAMLDAPYYAAFAVITRDRFGGRVAVDRDLRPCVRYTLNKYDKRHAIQGMAVAATIHAAAGASAVLSTHHDGVSFDPAVQGTATEPYREALEALDWAPNRAPVFSSHLMGTCRMGGNRNASPVAPDGRLFGCRNLYVADASVFPSASGINPMITIQALAHHTAECLAAEMH